MPSLLQSLHAVRVDGRGVYLPPRELAAIEPANRRASAAPPVVYLPPRELAAIEPRLNAGKAGRSNEPLFAGHDGDISGRFAFGMMLGIGREVRPEPSLQVGALNFDSVHVRRNRRRNFRNAIPECQDFQIAPSKNPTAAAIANVAIG